MTARAVFVAALLAGPLAAAGQSPGVAELEDTEGELNYIGLAECEGGTDTLDWTLSMVGSTTFTLGGTYFIVVSDDPPPTSGDGAGFCPPEDEDTKNVTILDFDADAGPSSNTDLQTADIPAALGFPCDPAATDKAMYLCVEWEDSAGLRGGFANAKLTLQLRPAPTPTNVRVTPSEEALEVRWDEGTVGAGEASSFEYVASAQAEGEAAPHTRRVRGLEARIEGLDIGTTYQVTVTAYSKGNNPSAPSAAVAGTPVEVEDFWEHYTNSGGTDDGGCASGPAGLGALAGLALALALRRRSA